MIAHKIYLTEYLQLLVENQSLLNCLFSLKDLKIFFFKSPSPKCVCCFLHLCYYDYMKIFLFILFISNLSYSYENNQLLLHNTPKKIDIIKLDTLNEKQINIFNKFQDKKIFLLNFWATWCPPCIKEIPELIKLRKKYINSIEVFFISVDSNPKKMIPKFLKKNKFEDFLIFIDNELKITKKLGVKIMPTTLIVDKDLNEIARVKGYIDWLDESVINELNSLL